MFGKRFRTVKKYSISHNMYFYYVERTVFGIWVQYDSFLSFQEKEAIEFACAKKEGIEGAFATEYTYITDDSC